MPYDELYRKYRDYFGTEPAWLVAEYYGLIDRKRPVLDIGAGQGRNALFLARHGYLVVAIDTSRAAIEFVSKRALEEDLPVQTHVSGFGGFRPRTDYYSAILLVGLLQVLDRVSIEILMARLSAWTAPGSLVFVTAFTTEDPKFAVHSIEGREIGKNSYIVQGSCGEEIRTYLEKGELSGLFSGWEIVHYREGMGPVHSHPGGVTERHGVVEAVFKR